MFGSGFGDLPVKSLEGLFEVTGEAASMETRWIVFHSLNKGDRQVDDLSPHREL